MSQVLASGIDVGNLVTPSAVFQTNESDPMKSVPVKVADRNGMKEPSYKCGITEFTLIGQKFTLITEID